MKRNIIYFFIVIFTANSAISFKYQTNVAIRQSSSSSSTSIFSFNHLYLDRMVERKKIVVDSMLRSHQDPSDPLVMRMSYIVSKANFNVTKSLKLPGYGKQNLHTMSVLVDLKRRSPTIPDKRNIVEFSTASKFAELLLLSGANAFLINLDEQEYGGQFNDLKACVNVMKDMRPENPPACIAKDIFIHPIQIAEAVENGATGVLLIVAVVGADLEVLLNSCTIMGIEAVVEVHTPNELEFALSRGATIFLINMWDRTTGKLFPDQAKGIASMMPLNAVAIAAGDIKSVEQAAELGFYGYDSVVLGRNIAEVPDIKGFIDGVHNFRGSPRNVGFGMKGLYWSE